MISRGNVAILSITVPFLLLALALVAMKVNFIVFAAFMFPIGFAGVVFIGFVRATVLDLFWRKRRRR